MKFQKVNSKRASEIEELTNHKIQFKTVDGSIKGVQIQTNIGPIFIELDSYSLTVNELATKEVYYLSWQASVASDVILMEKEFESEYERNSYIMQYLSNYKEDELTLEKRTVSDN